MVRGGAYSTAALFVITTLAACNAITDANDFSVVATGADGGKPAPTGTSKPSDGSRPPDEQSQPNEPEPPPKPTSVSVVAPDGLDFGAVTCGSTPPPRTVEIKNTSAGQITFQAEVSDPDSFVVEPAGGTVASGESTTLTVSASAIPSVTPVGERLATLTVTTSAPDDSPHALDTRLLVSGAAFSVSPTGTLDWGTLNGQAVKKTVLVRNDGNMAGTLNFSLSNYLSTYSINPKSLVLEGGQVGALEITAAPPKNGSTVKNGKVFFASSSTQCGNVPSTINLTCRRPD